jgi:peptidoglycan hydrolase-like protein with peptidoglycan-binding domain
MAEQEVVVSLRLTLPLLKEGEDGSYDATSRLQTMLNLWLDKAEKGGTPTPLKVDGVYGMETVRAVKGWQQNNGLFVDGQVGENTWTALITAWLTTSGPG